MIDHTKMLTRKEAAQYLCVSTKYLEYLAAQGQGPIHYQPTPKVIRYNIDDLDAWMFSNKIGEETKK